MRQVQTWCEPWPERTVGGLEISDRFTRRYLSRCQKVWYKFDLLTSASPCINAREPALVNNFSVGISF